MIEGIKSNREIAQEAARADSGFCNPRKIRGAAEAHMEAIFELESRGFTRAEAEAEIAEEQ